MAKCWKKLAVQNSKQERSFFAGADLTETIRVVEQWITCFPYFSDFLYIKSCCDWFPKAPSMPLNKQASLVKNVAWR